MTLMEGIQLGLDSVMQWQTLLLILIGSFIGTLVGALPGLGPTAGVGLLIPFAVSLPTVEQGLALLVSIYLGCMFGGRISSILINIPGDAAAVVTTWEGFPLMQQGRGGAAMGITAITSFVGGMISFIALATCAPALARAALNFGPPEYFAVMLFGFATVVGLADKKYGKAVTMLCLGALISTVGSDHVAGVSRYVFFPQLYEGIEFVIVVIGVYGFGEILATIETDERMDLSESIKLNNLLPTLAEVKSLVGCTLRGTTIGTLVGLLPGAGGTIASFITYSVEKGVAKDKSTFGKGNLQGLGGPEASNNASVGGALIPMFALGIPGSGTTAVILGALILFGLQPGPMIFQNSPSVVWSVIVGLFIANIMLLLANTLLIPVFVFLIRIGQDYLKPFIAVLCVIGVYSITYMTFHLYLLLFFGILGYGIKKFKYPIGPLILAIILAPMTEIALRQSLLMSRGSFAIFFTRPLCLAFLLTSIIATTYPLIKMLIVRIKNTKYSTKAC